MVMEAVKSFIGSLSPSQQPILVTLAVVFGSSVLFKWTRAWWRASVYARKRKEKAEQCHKALELLEDKLRNESQVTPERKSEILGWSLNELIQHLQDGSAKAVEVLHAYQIKALEVNKDINCLVEPIWEAEAQALECDLSSKKKGPLHGVPVSIKDNYGIEGYDCHVGCAKYIGQPFHDCVMVKVLKSLGAIPFVKTNVPQTMISFETTNPINGATSNPHQLSRGVGGSSGGEGALVAAKGSVLGFGSDIGGSIRIPASFCGVYGFKATEGRFSNKGCHPIGGGQNIMKAVYGPLAQDVDSLVLTLRTMFIPLMSELDPYIAPLPFRDEIYADKKPLRIGFYTQDGYFHAVPAMERGVMEAKAVLEKMGHEVVPVNFPDLGIKAAGIWSKAIFGDKGQEYIDILKDDKADASFKLVITSLRQPEWIKKIICFILRHLMPRMAVQAAGSMGLNSVAEWFDLVNETSAFRKSVTEQWKEKKLDAVICPGFGCPAIPKGMSSYVTGAASYTGTFNVLNFVAGSMPVSKVTREDEEKMENYPSPDLWHMAMKKCMVGTEGLPVNIQVVTLPYHEELCLRVMKDLETGLKE